MKKLIYVFVFGVIFSVSYLKLNTAKAEEKQQCECVHEKVDKKCGGNICKKEEK